MEKCLCYDDIREIAYYLEREHQGMEARTLKSVIRNVLGIIGENHMSQRGLRSEFQWTEECALYLCEGIQMINEMTKKLKGAIPKWVLNRLEEAKSGTGVFLPARPEIHPPLKSGSGASSNPVCSQPGDPETPAGYVVETGAVGYLDKRNTKGWKRI